MLNGKDLIIECDGKPLAAAKSCSIEINAATIQVSDIVHGGWEHYRAGRKSWKISTGHLVARYGILQLGYDSTNSQVSMSYSYLATPTPTVNPTTYEYLWAIERTTGNILTIGRYDFTNEEYINFHEGILQGLLIPGDYVMVATICHWSSLSAQEIQEIADRFHVDSASLPSTGDSDVIVNVVYDRKQGHAGMVKTFFMDDGDQSADIAVSGTGLEDGDTATPIKSGVANVGMSFTLKVKRVDNPLDTLTGTAICSKFKVTGSVGALSQGSFEFVGNSALE
jgi:hypothetical protein